MSEERMPNCPASASKGFSSTPIKSQGKTTSKGLDDDVVSDDEDTFSLLSPIYHDSFDSDEEELELPAQRTLSRQSDDSRPCKSPVRCELPKTPLGKMSSPAMQPADSPSLSAWQMWLLNKAKEDRLKLEKKAEEERLLREKKEQQEREREKKKVVMGEKIQEWLQIKREQERQQQVVKLRKEEEEMQRQQEKQREIKQKAQHKYRDWLQKKNEEKMEREKTEKEEAALKEDLEKERRRRAEVKFKEWLVKANEKSRTSSRSPCYPTSPYDKAYPAPSFYNPIPWKPIHIPPPETSPNQTKKPQKQRKSQTSSCSSFRSRNTVTAAHLLQRR
ncbi:coiled-coil domain-containing protein 34-like [Melanotaenia boesemani]|uniref:coiled-coil domain-containing protein 34-like n=1 Tax=Melanotaenia boesemani TaxID=1250792 RepID=UPI001C0498E7|nr:coiled-coil domain-containing protein 34-like [Melanotaenia boesemani]